MAKVVTLGEIMLRLSPPGYERFAQASRFDVNYGGAEANVAASLAQLGNNAAFLSKIPKNAIGDAAIATLKSLGVNCQYIARGGNGSVFIFWKTVPPSVLPAWYMTVPIHLSHRQKRPNLILIRFLMMWIYSMFPESHLS